MKLFDFFEVEKPRVLICWLLPAFSGYLVGGTLIFLNYDSSISGAVSVEKMLQTIIVTAIAFPFSFLLPQGLCSHAACLAFAFLQKQEKVRRHPFLASGALSLLIYGSCSAFHGIVQTEFVTPMTLHFVYIATAVVAGVFAILSRLRFKEMDRTSLVEADEGAAE